MLEKLSKAIKITFISVTLPLYIIYFQITFLGINSLEFSVRFADEILSITEINLSKIYLACE